MAATTSHRVWEENKSSPPAPKEQLPSISALTSNLPTGSSVPSPTSTRDRDSGAWSSRPESTRSSTYSTGTSTYLSSNTNSYYMSPNRASQLSSSSYNGGHASADYSIDRSSHPLTSPPHHGSALPSLNSVHEATIKEEEQRGFPPQPSRRSSIGSQLNQGVGQLHLNGFNSPYSASVNHSQASLTQSLNAQRGIPSHGLRTSRSSAQLQRSPPSAHLVDVRPQTSSTRQAPPIGNNPGREIVSGQEPTKGQAWSFPDFDGMEPGALPPNRSLSSRGHDSSEDIRLGSMIRRGSGHTSLASSILTTDSHLPPGQHRLDESIGGHSVRNSGINSNMSDVAEDESMTPEENHTPYSRTPALRVSHKMAERKRRSEMKDLFENLRSQIPSSQGSKSSKWEILSKASDYIKQLEQQAQHGGVVDHRYRAAMQEIEMTRDRESLLRNENQRLIHELQMLRQNAPTGQPGAPPPPSVPQQSPSAQPPVGQGHPQQPPPSASFTPQSYVPPPPPPPLLHDATRSLPPLGGSSGPAPSTGMEGVRYSH